MVQTKIQVDQILHRCGQQVVHDLSDVVDCLGECHFVYDLSGTGDSTLLHVMASLLLGHSATQGLVLWIRQTPQVKLNRLTVIRTETWLTVRVLGVGVVSLLLPTYPTNIARVLAEGLSLLPKLRMP